jgi:hypothetical protein
VKWGMEAELAETSSMRVEATSAVVRIMIMPRHFLNI